jgi:Ser/Thr protein kinase RdoA (MazF antagonist)
MIFEYIHGEHRDHINQKQEKQLIITAANLHHLTKDYQSVFLPYRWNYGIELCQNLALDTARRINTENSWAKLEWFSNELSNLCLPDTLPKGICHSDFDVSNLMFRGGQFISLLDYDDANYTFLIFDLAGLMNPLFPGFEWDTWFQYPINQSILNFQKARWVVEEYNTNRSLIQDEKFYLFDVYKLSVLMDCIWYFERGNVSDFFEKRKIDALNKLGRENFYRVLFEE